MLCPIRPIEQNGKWGLKQRRVYELDVYKRQVIYGYLWNEARDQWLVDPEAAEVAKRIFAMTIEGYGPYQIASKLKEEKVLIPSAYLAQHGEGVNKNKTFKDVYGWGCLLYTSRCV